MYKFPKKKKMVDDKRMLVGVFMTSFRFFVLRGVKEGEGRAMGTYNYVIFVVQSGISSPCKPVSLSYNLLSLLIIFFKQSVPAILTCPTLKAPSFIHNMPPTNWQQTLLSQKAAKSRARYTLVKYAVNKV